MVIDLVCPGNRALAEARPASLSHLHPFAPETSGSGIARQPSGWGMAGVQPVLPGPSRLRIVIFLVAPG